MTRLNNALVKHNGGESAPGTFFGGPVSIPAVDISETGEAYILHLDMPGAQKDAISVTVVNETLAVKAPIVPIHEGDTAVLYREIRTGVYERRFTLGQGIDRNKVEARYEDGVLTVRLLKTEGARPREIVIR
jgi:HSP20 family protein